MKESPRVVFMGTPALALPALHRLHQHAFPISAVYTQPPRPAGRGMKLVSSPIQEEAEALELTVETPRSLRQDDVQAQLKHYQPDVIVVLAYGLILPQAVLDIPKRGCINIHLSLLPRWRGAAPVQRAIEAGDTETGVTIMQMDAGLDTGPILRQQSLPLLADETSEMLALRLALLGAQLLIAELKSPSEPQLQNESGANYAHKLTKEEAELDLSQSAFTLERKIRAFNPAPICWVMHEGKRLKIYQAAALSAAAYADLSDKKYCLACGPDTANTPTYLQLQEIQKPGKKRQKLPIS